MAHGLQANPADEQIDTRPVKQANGQIDTQPAGNRTDLQMNKLTDEQMDTRMNT